MLTLQRIPPPRFPDVSMRTPGNWTAITFLALLGGVHLSVAMTAAINGRWEGSLSFLFAILFFAAALIARNWGTEIAFLPSCGTIRVRTGTRRWYGEKLIPFEDISAVRLTMDVLTDHGARIEIICRNSPLELPPTPIPHQQALFFSMMLGVPLVKISDGTAALRAGEETPTIPRRREETEAE